MGINDFMMRQRQREVQDHLNAENERLRRGLATARRLIDHMRQAMDVVAEAQELIATIVPLADGKTSGAQVMAARLFLYRSGQLQDLVRDVSPAAFRAEEIEFLRHVSGE